MSVPAADAGSGGRPRSRRPGLHGAPDQGERSETPRVAAESMLDGFAICSVARGENGRIVEFSCESVYDAACRLSGLTRERTRFSTLPEYPRRSITRDQRG